MSWTDPAVAVFHRLSPRTRERVKRLVGAGEERESRINSWRAKRLAATFKHPATVLQTVAAICTSTGRADLEGARVLEYGSGYLLADALIYTLFGADEVTAVDSAPVLQSKVFRNYAEKADWQSLIANALPEFDPDRAEKWLRRLRRATSRTNDDWYRDLGIRYVAPYDILIDNEPRKPYDLIVSHSTLEHAPPELAGTVFDRLSASLKNDGSAFHDIDLQDHRDFDQHPFAFLGAVDDYGPEDYRRRGNRLRASDWWQMCVEQPGLSWQYEASSPRINQLPNHLAPAYAAADPYDLAIGHLTLIGQRLPPSPVVPLPEAENPV